MKARKTANARWIARVCVSLKTRMPVENGSGEAIQSWNSDHAIATTSSSRATSGPGARPPVSLSLTSWLTSTSPAGSFFVLIASVLAAQEGRGSASRSPSRLV